MNPQYLELRIAAFTVLTCLLLLGGGCEPASDDRAAIEAEPDGPHLSPHEPIQLLTDLPEMREAGALRVLVHREDQKGLLRPGSPADEELALLTLFAETIDLPVEIVLVSGRDELIPALLEGRGDVVADRLTVTPARAEQVVFSTPVRQVDEVVVVAKGAEDAPRSIQDLVAEDMPPERQPHIRASSAFVESLEQAAEKAGGSASWVAIPEELDTDSVLARVGRGEYPLTVQDSDTVASYLTFASDVEVAFVLKERVPIAWAVRPSSERLVEAMNGFLFQGDLAGRMDQVYGGDLGAIRERGVLRVAMPNNSSSYFLYRGQPVGFQYELAQHLARGLGLRLQAVAPVRQADLGRLIRQGRVDLLAATLTVTERRLDRADWARTSEPLLYVDEVLVQMAGAEPITRADQLAGAQIHLRPTSSYWDTLVALRETVPGLEIVAAGEDLETEEIIDLVASGEVSMTVADSNVLERLLTYRDDVQGTLVLSEDNPLVYVVRDDQPELLAAVNTFVGNVAGSPLFGKLYKRYFEDERRIRQTAAASPRRGQLSPYDELVRKYSRQYGLDWRFVTAQMYQESGFDAEATSWAGARGLLQVMPATGRELGVDDPDLLYDPEIAIRTGVEYLYRMLQRFEYLPLEQQLHFALASYNAGYGHVLDARRLAETLQKHRDTWVDHVDDAIVLLEDPDYHGQARYGYCRGSEPRQYVRNIQGFYDAFSDVMPAEGVGD